MPVLSRRSSQHNITESLTLSVQPRNIRSCTYNGNGSKFCCNPVVFSSSAMPFPEAETALSWAISFAGEPKVVARKIARPCAPQGRPTNNQSLTRSVNDLHQLSTTCEDAPVRGQFVPGKLLLEVLGFQQQAGDVVVLRRVADEQIDFGHEALEHFGGLDRFSGFDGGQ
jgi:hypothetical protein